MGALQATHQHTDLRRPLPIRVGMRVIAGGLMAASVLAPVALGFSLLMVAGAIAVDYFVKPRRRQPESNPTEYWQAVAAVESAVSRAGLGDLDATVDVDRSNYPNASAAHRGAGDVKVTITRGLLHRPDLLPDVLAHEAAHLRNRDSYRLATPNALPALVRRGGWMFFSGAFLIGGLPMTAANLVPLLTVVSGAEAVAKGVRNVARRRVERQADLGVRAAGGSPEGLARALLEMSALDRDMQSLRAGVRSWALGSGEHRALVGRKPNLVQRCLGFTLLGHDPVVTRVLALEEQAGLPAGSILAAYKATRQGNAAARDAAPRPAEPAVPRVDAAAAPLPEAPGTWLPAWKAAALSTAPAGAATPAAKPAPTTATPFVRSLE